MVNSANSVACEKRGHFGLALIYVHRSNNRRVPFFTSHRMCQAALFLCSCAFAAPNLEPPKLRLPDTVQPIRYAVDLTVIPDRDTFQGAVAITIDIRSATNKRRQLPPSLRHNRESASVKRRY